MAVKFIEENPRPHDYFERNDCAVRALTLAGELDYVTVHKTFTKHGRKPRRGVTVTMLENAIFDLVPDAVAKIPYRALMDKPTLNQFLQRMGNVGHWVVIKRGHAFAIKNGIVYDGHEQGARCKIKAAYRIK